MLRDEPRLDGVVEHNLVVFPSVPLRPSGHYAFVVTNRVLTTDAQPIMASDFFQRVTTGHANTPVERRVAKILTPILAQLEHTTPPLRQDDLALVLGISVRSLREAPSDLLSIRKQLQAMPSPAFSVVDVAPDSAPDSDVAAIVHGKWSPPSWQRGPFVARDASGRPSAVGSTTLEFTLALPKSAASSPAPLIMLQHGLPGKAEDDVPMSARRGLAKAGFAVIGFTDVVGRSIIPGGDTNLLNSQVLTVLLRDHALPDYLSLLPHADQLAFLRMIPTLSTLDVLPLGHPDGVPDLNPEAPLGYLGLSQGAVQGEGLLGFAPEIHAAVLAAGGGGYAAYLIHQYSASLYQELAELFPGFTRTEFYVSMALLQIAFDRQDSQNLARYAYREKLDVGSRARASVLLTEGLGDSLVPWFSTRGAASQLMAAQIEPRAAAVPFLQPATPPLRANVDERTTSGFFQFVPSGYSGVAATPGCVELKETQGHYCAQMAREAIEQRTRFFVSALSGVPQIDQ